MTCPFGYGRLLPRGLLREPLSGIRRAQIAMLTRCDQVSEHEIANVISTIQRQHPMITIVRSTHRPSGLLCHPSKRMPIDQLSQKRVALISGIGNPAAFRRTVESVGAQVIAEKILSADAVYDRETVEGLRHWVSEQSAIEMLICTQKDLVKLQTDRIAGVPLVALTIDADVQHSGEFEALLSQIAASC